jgi:hypothetical protein
MRAGSGVFRVSVCAGTIEAVSVRVVFDLAATCDRRRAEADRAATDRRGRESATRRAVAGAGMDEGISVRGAVATGDVTTGSGEADSMGAAAAIAGVEAAVSKLPERLSRLADMISRTSVLSSASTSATGFESSEHAASVAVAPRVRASVRRAVFIRGSVRLKGSILNTHMFFKCATVSWDKKTAARKDGRFFERAAKSVAGIQPREIGSHGRPGISNRRRRTRARECCIHAARRTDQRFVAHQDRIVAAQ